LQDEVLDLFPASLSKSFRTAEVDGVGLYQFGVELVLADDLAKTVADLGATAVAIRVSWRELLAVFGIVPISSTEQMPMP
jgi:hypothetical protein